MALNNSAKIAEDRTLSSELLTGSHPSRKQEVEQTSHLNVSSPPSTCTPEVCTSSHFSSPVDFPPPRLHLHHRPIRSSPPQPLSASSSRPSHGQPQHLQLTLGIAYCWFRSIRAESSRTNRDRCFWEQLSQYGRKKKERGTPQTFDSSFNSNKSNSSCI